MRRIGLLLGLFILTTGFHHGHGHHHGSGVGCGSAAHHSGIEVSGRVKLNAQNEGGAVIQLRTVGTGKPLVGQRVLVNDALLTEIVPGVYASALEGLHEEEPIDIHIGGNSLRGVLPTRAGNLKLAGSPGAEQVSFLEDDDERVLIVGRGEVDSPRVPVSFQAGVQQEVPVPQVAGLRAVQLDVESEAAGAGVVGEVVLEVESELSLR